MESLEHKCGNILLTSCTKRLIFGKDTFLVLISRMISTNPIHFCGVTLNHSIIPWCLLIINAPYSSTKAVKYQPNSNWAVCQPRREKTLGTRLQVCSTWLTSGTSFHAQGILVKFVNAKFYPPLLDVLCLLNTITAGTKAH